MPLSATLLCAWCYHTYVVSLCIAIWFMTVGARLPAAISHWRVIVLEAPSMSNAQRADPCQDVPCSRRVGRPLLPDRYEFSAGDFQSCRLRVNRPRLSVAGDTANTVPARVQRKSRALIFIMCAPTVMVLAVCTRYSAILPETRSCSRPVRESWRRALCGNCLLQREQTQR